MVFPFTRPDRYTDMRVGGYLRVAHQCGIRHTFIVGSVDITGKIF